MGTLQGGGLGNRLFELVSTYAIARTLERRPFIRVDQRVLYNIFQSLTNRFPNIVDYYSIVDRLPKRCIKTVSFGNNYAIYDNVNRLTKYNADHILKLSGWLLQR